MMSIGSGMYILLRVVVFVKKIHPALLCQYAMLFKIMELWNYGIVELWNAELLK
jgi:hypothetical protein